MRFSSIVALVVVTASFALGGCAADAEQTGGGSTTDENLTLSAEQSASEHSETARYFAKAGTEEQRITAEDRVRVYGDKENVRTRLPKTGGAFGGEATVVASPSVASSDDIEAVAEEHHKGAAPKH